MVHPHADHLFIAHGPDASFPSDHATASMAIAVAILLRGKRGWGTVTLAASLILLYGRVALGLHYPTDVLGGAALGALSAIALARPLPRRRLDWLADSVGGAWDQLVDAVLRALGVGGATDRA